jgi:hypothetical protein
MPGSESLTVGAVGTPHRASVAPWGAVTVWRSTDTGPEKTLDWHVAADDRWHAPASESTVRQRRLDGTAVVETRLRVPDGDVVQRVYTVPDRGGLTIVEVENESPLALAVAFSGCAVLTERPPTDAPIRGIELSQPAVVLPIGHRSKVRVAVPHTLELASTADGLRVAPPVDNVVRGWLRVIGRASRIAAPESGVGEALVSARCDLLLEGPVDVEVDPVGFVLDVAELVRCGEPADRWLPDIVGPVERRVRRGRADDHDTRMMLDAALRVADAAGDERARRDIERIRARCPERVEPSATVSALAEVVRTGSVGRFVSDVESFFVDEGRLLPHGLPPSWNGVDFDVHGLPAGPLTTVSFAIRWHGRRPAVLWERAGAVRELVAPAVAPGWRSDAATGEDLWPAPVASPERTALPLSVDDDVSFG